MFFWKKIERSIWLDILVLALIAAFAYLPRVWELTYNKDDWYFMYNGLVHGAGIFREIALHTRPLRGLFYDFLYTFFGPLPLPYHLTSYLFRLLGALGAYWLFNLLWPRGRQFSLLAATLFVLFPGFYWWVSGFELQPNVISVGLEAFSIAFTLKAIDESQLTRRILYTFAAFVTGWIYLAFVEYAIGMEGFRLLCVYLLVRRKHGSERFVSSVGRTLRSAAIFFLIPVSFVIWYQFFFDNWRGAQDAATQLGALFTSPLMLARSAVSLMQSMLNISVLAWFVPFHENFPPASVSDILVGIFFAGAAVLVLSGHAFILQKHRPQTEDRDVESTAGREALWVGLLGTLAGVLAIVLANRSAVFSRVSQYTLPASLAGALLMVGIIYSIFPHRLKMIVFSALMALAILSHHGLAARAVTEQEAIAKFWWQVTWRAPDIRDDTLLVAHYPDVQYMDNEEMVWGPANFIYNPEAQPIGPARVLISAARDEQEAINNIIMGSRDFDRTDLVIKYVSIHYNYKNILVITQPTAQSCVHLIDQRWPDISYNDDPIISIASTRSDTSNVGTSGSAPVPQRYIFKTEPSHGWCYYYQKADLARQQGDWEEVIRLEGEAAAQGLHPNDQIEWMPFLQAHAFLGHEKEVKQISTRINSEPFYKGQACSNLLSMDEHGYELSEQMRSYIEELFCKGTN